MGNVCYCSKTDNLVFIINLFQILSVCSLDAKSLKSARLVCTFWADVGATLLGRQRNLNFSTIPETPSALALELGDFPLPIVQNWPHSTPNWSETWHWTCNAPALKFVPVPCTISACQPTLQSASPKFAERWKNSSSTWDGHSNRAWMKCGPLLIFRTSPASRSSPENRMSIIFLLNDTKFRTINPSKIWNCSIWP